MPKKLPWKEFKNIYGKVPRLCLDVLIKDRRGIILSKRDIPPALNQWHIPGGTLLFKEKISDAINRITIEETGLRVRLNRILGIVEYSKDSSFGHSVGIVCLTKPVGGKLRGSIQAKEVNFFNKIPPNTIIEQKKFLVEKRLLK